MSSSEDAKFELLEKQVHNAIEVTIHRILNQAIHLVKKFPPNKTANLLKIDAAVLQKCMVEDLMKVVEVTRKIVPNNILCDLIVKKFPFIKKNIRRRLSNQKALEDSDEGDDGEDLGEDEKDKKEIDEENEKDKEEETKEDKDFVAKDDDEKDEKKEDMKDDEEDKSDSENDEDYQPSDEEKDKSENEKDEIDEDL